MRHRHIIPAFIAIVSSIALTGTLAACSGSGPADRESAASSTLGDPQGTPISILSGSENQEIRKAIDAAGKAAHAAITMHYQGSVDIMSALNAGAKDYDAVWPASSIWTGLGDTGHIVKRSTSISTTPVVLGVKESQARQLGWDKADPTLDDIVAAVDAGRFTFAMTSATQSNSGASAYLGFLQTLSGSSTPLTAASLDDAQLREKARSLLSGVNRSSGSSDWLKQAALEAPDDYPAMFNYEALLISANRELKAQGKEQYRLIYPQGGVAMADSPLGYVNHGDAAKSKAFDGIVAYLTGARGRAQIAATGRRTGLGGRFEAAGTKGLDPAWGVRTEAPSTVALPAAEVTRKALDLYQTDLRKPSATAWVLDYSGSMNGTGETDLEAGMAEVLDPAKAKRNMLSAGPDDRNVIIPFSDYPGGTFDIDGNDDDALDEGLGRIQDLEARGGTEMYRGLVKAADWLDSIPAAQATRAVVLMTDGQSGTADRDAAMDRLKKLGVPVFAITYGSANRQQLDEIARATHGRVFDGTKDLVTAIKQAKGYN